MFVRDDLELPLPPEREDRTQLAISARYRPPLGVVGQAITGRLTRRLDDTTMRS